MVCKNLRLLFFYLAYEFTQAGSSRNFWSRAFVFEFAIGLWSKL